MVLGDKGKKDNEGVWAGMVGYNKKPLKGQAEHAVGGGRGS